MNRNETRDKLFAGITILFCLLLFCKRLTGEVCHAVLGLLLLSITVVHIYRHIRKLKYKKPSVQMVDRMLFIALVFKVKAKLMPGREKFPIDN